MEKYKNRHLNVFDSYTQNNEDPVENNMSRGLAILLRYFPELFYMLLFKIKDISMVNKNDFDIWYEDINGYDVQIQVPIVIDKEKIHEKESEYKKVIGIALTTEKERINKTIPYQKNTYPEGKVILDICVSWNDILIIIECKRTEEDPTIQLNEQVNLVIKKYNMKETEPFFVSYFMDRNIIVNRKNAKKRMAC